MVNKRCCTCGIDLPVTEFGRKEGAVASKCKPCQRAYSRRHYRANKAEYIARARLRTLTQRDSNTLKLLDYLESHPCVDCGDTDPVVLEFDHVRGKERHVSQMILDGMAWPAVMREIARCEVRCANCHRRRHARERRMVRTVSPLGLTAGPGPRLAGIGNLSAAARSSIG